MDVHRQRRKKIKKFVWKVGIAQNDSYHSAKIVCVWSFVLKIIIKLTLDNKFCDDNKT